MSVRSRSLQVEGATAQEGGGFSAGNLKLGLEQTAACEVRLHMLQVALFRVLRTLLESSKLSILSCAAVSGCWAVQM